MHISDKDDLIRFIDKNNVNFSLHWSMEAGTTMIYSITLREFTSPNLQHPNGVEQEYNEAYVEVRIRSRGGMG